MVIRRSSAAEIDALIRSLDGAADIDREASVARLAIIGTRAVERLSAALPALSASGRLAALQALEVIADPRCLDAVAACLDDPVPEVGSAAAAAARACLAADADAAVLDRLGALVIDRRQPERARLLALDALADLPAAATAGLLRVLADDPSAALRARAARPEAPQAVASGVVEEAVIGRFPSDPERVRAMVARHGREAPLPSLHRLIEAIRGKEGGARDPLKRTAWSTARAAVHQVLAERGSNVALHDLRETIERADGPVAVEFLAALRAIGDESCLEPIVMAFARTAAAAPAARADWWQTHLAETFREIVHRERLTGRHAVIRRIRSRWPGAAAGLLDPRRRRGAAARLEGLDR